MDSAATISASREDYLEAIMELSEGGEAVRVTDVALRLHVAKASVSQGIAALKRMGLVSQERYGRISLSSRGVEQAARVIDRHRILRKFLVEMLGVDAKVAEKDACMMEHVVSPETLSRIVAFLENVADHRIPAGREFAEPDSSNRNSGDSPAGRSAAPSRVENHREEVRSMGPANVKTLGDMMTGERGRVCRINAEGALRRRILDMGMTPGTEVTVKGVAPLGDPIEVMVRGYNLSLRRQEAAGVVVEV